MYFYSYIFCLGKLKYHPGKWEFRFVVWFDDWPQILIWKTDLALPPKQTHNYENITFLQLLLRAVIRGVIKLRTAEVGTTKIIHIKRISCCCLLRLGHWNRQIKNVSGSFVPSYPGNKKSPWKLKIISVELQSNLVVRQTFKLGMHVMCQLASDSVFHAPSSMAVKVLGRFVNQPLRTTVVIRWGDCFCATWANPKKTTLTCHVIVRVDIFIIVDHLRTNDMASVEYQQGQLQPKHGVISTMVSTCILNNDGWMEKEDIRPMHFALLHFAVIFTLLTVCNPSRCKKQR